MKSCRCFCLLFVLGVACCISITVNAEDSYEQSIADALSQRVEPQELVWLNGKNGRFIALYSEALTETARGAVIIVHSMGGHPDWPQIISPLRLNLPATGWATLSIQMPVLEPGASITDYGKTVSAGGARLKVALQHLRDKALLNIAIIAYSFGAATTIDFLADNKEENIFGFVGISIQSQAFLNPRLNLVKKLEQVNIPVLDIYGSRDFNEVVRLADERRLAGDRKNRRHYQQIVIDGADHYFTGLESVLIKRIREWLDKTAANNNVITGEKITAVLGLQRRLP